MAIQELTGTIIVKGTVRITDPENPEKYVDLSVKSENGIQLIIIRSTGEEDQIIPLNNAEIVALKARVSALEN